MPIKIVGEDEQTKKQVTCKNCAAILEYTKADTKTRSHTDISGTSDEVRQLTCPRCQAVVYVPLH
jgi:RNase P subunit RPR2